MGWPKGGPRTQDQRERIGATLRTTLAADPELVLRRIRLGPHSEETKAKIAKAHIGLKHSTETRAKMSASMKGRVISPEQRAAVSQRHKGKTVSMETRSRLSKAGFGHKAHFARTTRFAYRGQRMRSSYEVRTAAALDALGVRWAYEPTRFHCGTFTYTPDFHLTDEGVYWEVKGWYGPDSQRKVEAFRSQYPEVPLVLFTKSCLEVVEAAARAANSRTGDSRNGSTSLN